MDNRHSPGSDMKPNGFPKRSTRSVQSADQNAGESRVKISVTDVNPDETSTRPLDAADLKQSSGFIHFAGNALQNFEPEAETVRPAKQPAADFAAATTAASESASSETVPVSGRSSKAAEPNFQPVEQLQDLCSQNADHKPEPEQKQSEQMNTPEDISKNTEPKIEDIQSQPATDQVNHIDSASAIENALNTPWTIDLPDPDAEARNTDTVQEAEAGLEKDAMEAADHPYDHKHAYIHTLHDEEAMIATMSEMQEMQDRAEMRKRKSKVGLVVEGGGTKIAYTAGVLKCLLENRIYLPYTVGISSGSEVLLSYVSRQIHRLEVTALESTSQKSAIGLIPMIKEGSIFGIDATADYIEKRAPLDFMAFFGSETEMDTGIYDLQDHQVYYFGKEYVDEDMTLIKASCALLLLAKPYTFRGRKYIDAGLVDMISINQSIKAGCDKHLIISTKEEGYTRKPAPGWQQTLARQVYRDPVITQALKERHLRYNEQWDLISSLEKEGKAMVLRPHKDLKVTRYTTDPRKLGPWFQLGYDETKERLPEIRRFCECD